VKRPKPDLAQHQQTNPRRQVHASAPYFMQWCSRQTLFASAVLFSLHSVFHLYQISARSSHPCYFIIAFPRSNNRTATTRMHKIQLGLLVSKTNTVRHTHTHKDINKNRNKSLILNVVWADA
jgi:hypothetical protein